MSTSDQELLELAAKAAELPERGWMGPAFMYVKGNTFTDWNPLNDQDEALVLAAKLDLSILNTGVAVAVSHWCGRTLATELLQGTDHCAATRRAIVRAAAELGRVGEL